MDDVPYVRQLVGELSPARIRMAAGLNGVRPPPAMDFDYCELGCGQGDTLAALAAAYPEARFLGVDLVAAHVAAARRLAREGGVENLGVLERDFSDLVDEDVGEFDYVVAHGVLSWVSPKVRQAMLAFARAKLKPGGLLYVSYNAMPGWAAVEPLRQLLLFGGAKVDASASTLERARAGLAFAQSMERAGAQYFTKNPAASEMLETMAKAGLPYIVHEYLHEHWSPMYFARVAWEMAESDLHFAGSLPAHANVRDLALPEAPERLLATVTDRVTFESLKDFAIDEFFRRDVFVKGAAPRGAAEQHRYLDETVWGTLTETLPPQVRLPHRTIALEGSAALFATLAQGGTTLTRLAAAPADREELRTALIRLLFAEQVLPLQAPTRVDPPRAAGLFSIPSVYNQTMLRRLSPEGPIVLASVVAGTALPISALEGLAIGVLTEVAGPGRQKWVEDLVGRSVLRIRVGDHVLEDRAEQQRAILEAVARIETRGLAKLVELGILAPVA